MVVVKPLKDSSLFSLAKINDSVFHLAYLLGIANTASDVSILATQ